MLASRLLLFLPAAFSFRLINPQWEELIRHVLVEANATFQATGQGLADADLLELCRDGLLTDPFPQFICPLMELNSMSQTVPKGPLDSTVVRSYNQAVDIHNHPCNHTAGLSCVVLFLPLNRILFGCARVSAEVLEAPADFQETFVVSHRVVDELECEKDSYGDPLCSLESVFVKGLIVQEQHSCCCFSSQCAVLYFDQGSHGLPFIRMVIDVEQLFEEGEELRRKKRELEWPPLSNGAGHDITTDIFLCGGILSVLFVFLFLAICRSYDLNEEDEQEAMAYGIEPQIVQKIFPQSIFQPSFTVNTSSLMARGQPSALSPALVASPEDKQEVIVSSDTMVQ